MIKKLPSRHYYWKPAREKLLISFETQQLCQPCLIRETSEKNLGQRILQKHQNVAVMKELIKKKSCKRIGYGHILFCTSMTKKLTKGMRWGVKAKKDSCAIQKFEGRRGRLVTL